MNESFCVNLFIHMVVLELLAFCVTRSIMHDAIKLVENNAFLPMIIFELQVLLMRYLNRNF